MSCLDHIDGTLADAGFSALVDEIAAVIGEFRPDVVITFGPDGGYGHPDHVTISAVTTAACQWATGPGHRPGRTVTRPLRRPPRIYYRCFPPGDLLIMERLVTWLNSRPDRFAGTPAVAHALLLAEAARTMGHIRDHNQVRWYPPGSYVVEQGPSSHFMINPTRRNGPGGGDQRWPAPAGSSAAVKNTAVVGSVSSQPCCRMTWKNRWRQPTRPWRRFLRRSRA